MRLSIKRLLPLTALLLGAASAGGAGAPVAKNAAFRSVPCPKTVTASQCGYVTVPLNHAKPGGQKIELFVAVQKATAPEQYRQSDPLFYVEGGPGAPSSPSVGPLGQVFANRDVVGIDQRGIGRSLPSLQCPKMNELNTREDITAKEISGLFSKVITDCAATLRAKGVELEYFNTTQAALDIEAVRRALGYSKINLYGASYGTRLTQEVMRRAPGGLRAVVLDSVIPTQVDRVARTGESVELALGRVFAACQKDEACNSNYPHLAATYQQTLKQLNEKPLSITVKGSGGELDGATFQGMLLASMYFTPGVQEIPSLIFAAQQGKTQPIENSFAAQFGENLSDAMTWGAFFTNECVGEVAYSTPQNLQNGLKNATEFADALALVPGISSPAIFKLCQDIGLARPAPQENTPVRSSVPALLLAGEFDPVTPASWLPEAAEHMSQAQQVVIAGSSHGSGLTSECGFITVLSFLQDPQQKVDTTCAKTGKLNFK